MGEQMRDAWEKEAGDWIARARTPGHDHFFWSSCALGCSSCCRHRAG